MICVAAKLVDNTKENSFTQFAQKWKLTPRGEKCYCSCSSTWPPWRHTQTIGFSKTCLRMCLFITQHYFRMKSINKKMESLLQSRYCTQKIIFGSGHKLGPLRKRSHAWNDNPIPVYNPDAWKLYILVWKWVKISTDEQNIHMNKIKKYLAMEGKGEIRGGYELL